MSKILLSMLGLMVLAGCLGKENRSAESVGDLGDSDELDSADHTTRKFTEAMVAGDFARAWNLLSPSLKAAMPAEQLQSRWREATSHLSNVRIAEQDVGELPDTAEEYGFQTGVPRQDWVAWEFVSFGSEEGLLEVRALVIRQKGAKAIEHFEIGEAE